MVGNMTERKLLLLVAHAPSPNTLKLREAVAEGARHEDVEGVDVKVLPPLEAGPDDVLTCDGIILGTTENLAYMSGALKDFFDRSYYPVLEEKQGLPCALYIRAGQDGTGTRRAVESIVTGLRRHRVQDALGPGSYTHLTLPPGGLGAISEVRVSAQKKQKTS